MGLGRGVWVCGAREPEGSWRWIEMTTLRTYIFCTAPYRVEIVEREERENENVSAMCISLKRKAESEEEASNRLTCVLPDPLHDQPIVPKTLPTNQSISLLLRISCAITTPSRIELVVAKERVGYFVVPLFARGYGGRRRRACSGVRVWTGGCGGVGSGLAITLRRACNPWSTRNRPPPHRRRQRRLHLILRRGRFVVTLDESFHGVVVHFLFEIVDSFSLLHDERLELGFWVRRDEVRYKEGRYKHTPSAFPLRVYQACTIRLVN